MSKRSGTDEEGRGTERTMERKRKKKSRWAAENEDKAFIPGMPTVLPTNMTETQQRQYLIHLQIEDISRKLRSGDLGIPPNPDDRSPSPEPIYNNEGKRLNTREYRTRKRLEEDRHALILEATQLNEDYKPPADYKPPVIRVSDKVMIPQDEHPDINFVGLLIGPRGNTLKKLEKDTGAKIIIRGKGSVKEGKIGRKDGQPLPGEDEPLHAYVTATNPENVKMAVDKIKDIIEKGVDVPEGQNDLRREQLRELALLNGTLRENDGLMKLKQLQEAQTVYTNTILCTVCGGAGHLSADCKQKRPGDSFRQNTNPGAFADKAKMDSEYMSLMAELGEAPPPDEKPNRPPPGCNMRTPGRTFGGGGDRSFGGGGGGGRGFGDGDRPFGGGGHRGPKRDIPGLMNLQPKPSLNMGGPGSSPRHGGPPSWQSGPPGPPGPPSRDNGNKFGGPAGMPPPSLLSAPPPPPPSGQSNNYGGWQPPPRGSMMGVPPPPPTTTSHWGSSYNSQPWQTPSPVAPPPPPPPTGFGVPPPPPPSALTPLLGAPPPPPPPK